MKTKVIITVFKYKKNVLYGSIIDLYIVYHWALKITDDIEIITDIDNILFESLRESITEKIIAPDTEEMENFITKLQNLETKDSIKFDNSKNDRIIFYFSGHTLDGKILTPSGKYSFEDFKNDLLISNKDSKIFCIFDCCNPPNLNLKYEYKDSTFIKNINYTNIDNDFIVFASSKENQKSNMKISGSIFTKYLFLKLNLRDFDKISKEVNKSIQFEKIEQNMKIYSSKIITPLVQNWMIKKSDFDILIEDNCVIIIK